MEESSLAGERWAMTDAPSSRVSSVVSMLGDLTAFAASFLIFGDVIAAGALGIAQFYVLDPDVESIVDGRPVRRLTARTRRFCRACTLTVAAADALLCGTCR